MDWFDKLVRNLTIVNDKRHEIEAKGKPPRWVTHKERNAWNRAAQAQSAPKTRAQVIGSISRQGPRRYARLRRDMKWLEKQAVKHGLSPDDARWLV